MLLAVTSLTFPLIYLALELPKRIINDAISGTDNQFEIFSIGVSQVQFLLALCLLYILVILLNGLLKMRLNTMKGVLAERLLSRFRFQLLNRLHRYPRKYFQTTSQGELVSVVTSEAEPMGGLMGDILSQPVFQAGQMLTILVFLFAQNVWFGLASITMIPLQAWLIPYLQRKINLLNKSRIQEVRHLSGEIGESAAGISDIRTNGPITYRLSVFSSRLAKIFSIRNKIYQKKFFMKFINNLINQITPFFFYSVGGYLAIKGEITVGALVAALAAHKDLSSPWKELLTYYNQVQDITPTLGNYPARSLLSRELATNGSFRGIPQQIPKLDGDICLTNVTLNNENGDVILDDISLHIPKGSKVAIQSVDGISGTAFAHLLTREILPDAGEIKIGDYELNSLHQAVIANRIGYVHANPYLLEGTLGDNIMLPFKQPAEQINQTAELFAEPLNNPDEADIENHVVPQLGGFNSEEEIHDWWFKLVQAMGTDDFMVRRTLRSVLDPAQQPQLTSAIVQMRPQILERLQEKGLDRCVHHYNRDSFNIATSLASNLLYALPNRQLTLQDFSRNKAVLAVLKKARLQTELVAISLRFLEDIYATFGMKETSHPLFKQLQIDDESYENLIRILKLVKDAEDRQEGIGSLSTDDYALLLVFPLILSAEQLGPALCVDCKEKIIEVRNNYSKQLTKPLQHLFTPIDCTHFYPGQTLLQNAVFGHICELSGAKENVIEDQVVEVLSELGYRRMAAQAIFDLNVSFGGTNIPQVFRERAAFSRAGIKRPDILVLENALASHSIESRKATRRKLNSLLPDTTKIYIKHNFQFPEDYDIFLEIVDGKIIQQTSHPQQEKEKDKPQSDLGQKLNAIRRVDMFSNLDEKDQKLIAFSAHWLDLEEEDVIFNRGQDADAAYLCVEGLAELRAFDKQGYHSVISEIEPGRLIGDLSVIVKSPRPFDLVAVQPSRFLRIGGKELLTVVNNDPKVASAMLTTVSGYLSNTIGRLYGVDPDDEQEAS